MTRFSDEVRIIPGVARVLAVLSWLCFFVMLFFVWLPRDHETRLWPVAGQFAFAIWPGLLVAIYVLLIGYINADARRRGMRYVAWTFAALLIPNSIGIILYFVFRQPMLAGCSKCGAQARVNYAFCPQCGNQMAPACPVCKRNVEEGWQRCPYCGTALGAGSASPPATAPSKP